MPRKPISFELDFMVKDIFPRFTVKQFDDVSFNIKPKNQGLNYNTTGMTAKVFVGVNNDMFMQTTGITVSSDNINVLLDKNMLQKNGRAYAEIELTDDAGTITSSSFIFDIDPKIGEGGQIPGEYEGFVEKYERLISEFKSQVSSTVNNCNTNVNNKLNSVDSLINVKISDFETRFNRLTSSQQQSSEIIDARDNEVSLKARLDRDIEKAKQVYVNVEGSHISTDSNVGYAKDIEILGNTIQDVSNLADIRSVGDKVEGQELYEIDVVSTNGLDKLDSDYQEDKLTILSPVQLEKVGDVADRIICKDGVWGVEKNVGTTVFDGTEHWIDYLHPSQIGVNTIPFYINYPGSATVSNVISNSFIQNGVYNTDVEGIAKDTNNDWLIIRILKSKLTTDDLAGFKSYLQANPLIVKLLLAQHQFIPLPHDQQIKLRTFANKTNISFRCEIEGTIKAQVPKSIGATVNTHTEQIGNLSKELDRVKKLEESTVSTVATESDFTTVEATSNGYFEDVKLEGKTLVNLIDYSQKLEQGSIEGQYLVLNGESSSFDVSRLREKDFTIIAMPQGNNPYTIHTTNSVGDNINVYMNKVGGFIILHKAHAEINNIRIYTNSGITEKIVLIVLEGDHTQNPPSYFEGLKSVGDGAEEVSVESVNENLLEFDSVFTSGVGSWGSATLLDRVIHDISLDSNLCKVTIANNSNYHFLAFKTIIRKGVSYSYKFDSTSNLGSDVSLFKDLSSTRGQVVDGDFSGTFVANDDYNYIALPINREVNTYSVSNFILTKDTQVTKHTPHQSDKKRILYYNEETQTWEKPILRQWDSIEKHSDGKYYYHKRSGEITLDGSEHWRDVFEPTLNTIGFTTTIQGAKGYLWGQQPDNTYEFSDKFNYVNDLVLLESDMEGFTIDSQYSQRSFRINKSKLKTQDVAGFKAWLQANPTTVVYQLEQEEVYECTNIDLITYANETNYIVNAGAITPRTTLKLSNSVGNVVNLLKSKISILEDLVYKLIQNK